MNLKPILLVLICALACFAQNPNTAVYPGSVSSDANLFVNNFGTATLKSSITPTQTTMSLNSSLPVAAPLIIAAGSELILCTSVSNNDLSGCTRGYRNTPAAGHSGAIQMFADLNQTNAEIKALQGLLGANLGCTKTTVGFAALTAAALTQAVTLSAVPANSQIVRLRVKHSVQFASGTITSLTVQLGDGTTANAYAPPFQVLTTAVGATALWDDGGAFSTTTAAHNVVATFTAVGANLGNGTTSALSAGSVDVTVCTGVLP